jgi:phosphatidylglycerol lysyltransferase
VADAPSLERARALVLRYGWNSTVYQILNPGMVLWFGEAGDAVVGYVSRRQVRVVAGAPVCPREQLPQVVATFEADAARNGERVCYFHAATRLEAVAAPPRPYATVAIGSQPCWDPRGWEGVLAGKASLRAQLNRARNKGVAISEWPAEQARDHPRLTEILDQWLATRGLPPLHFLVEPQTLSRLFDRRIFVAERAGAPVGFLVASPIPQRNGWLVEQVIRGRHAPNGTAELLVDAAMHSAVASGHEYVTLGLVPLSRRVTLREYGNAPWLRLLLRWVRAHGRRFYNFDGLETFKSKLQPDAWEPIFAIANTPHFSPAMLYAVAAAFTTGSPARMIAGVLAKALREELRQSLGGARREPA